MPQVARQTGAQPAPPSEAQLLAAAKEYDLPSGLHIWWLAPDEMELLAFTGEMPDPLTSAIYMLLEEEGAIVKENDPASFQRKRSHERAKHAIVRAGMVKPVYDPDLVLGDGVNVLGRRQLPRNDVAFMYNWLFRLGTTPAAFAASQTTNEPERVADAAPDRGELRDHASGTDQAGDTSE